MKVLLATCFLLFGLPAMAGDFDHKHQSFTDILQKRVVVDGALSRVDYAGLRQDPAPLNAYLAQLSAVTAEEFSHWKRAEQMAFLINAYNAFTLKLIVDNPPVASIKDLGSLFQGPWSKPFFNLFGKPSTLDNVEHDALRRNYSEPRLHFILNCASIGCPMLPDHAVTADELETQLETQTRLFLSDTSRNRVDEARRTLTLSPIFNWYEDDFDKASGSVPAFVSRYLPLAADPSDYDVEYSRYDWSLNTSSPATDDPF